MLPAPGQLVCGQRPQLSPSIWTGPLPQALPPADFQVSKGTWPPTPTRWRGSCLPCLPSPCLPVPIVLTNSNHPAGLQLVGVFLQEFFPGSRERVPLCVPHPLGPARLCRELAKAKARLCAAGTVPGARRAPGTLVGRASSAEGLWRRLVQRVPAPSPAGSRPPAGATGTSVEGTVSQGLGRAQSSRETGHILLD